MRQHRHRPLLTPAGLSVERIEIRLDQIIAVARSPSKMSFCPSCGRASSRVRSRYQWSLADLPAHGRSVEINVMIRRFRCATPICPRKIFAERLGESIAVPFARRTARLESVVHRLGLALGGRPGHSLAERFAIPVSKDTLLRTVRRRSARPGWPLRAVGIDDWAWRRGCRYGTVVCDLERHRIVALHTRHKDELARVARQIQAIVEAIKDGMRTPAMRDELLALENRKIQLSSAVATRPVTAVRLHPNLAEIHRNKVARLHEELNHPELREEASTAIRSLIDEVRLVPVDGKLAIELAGALAGILALTRNNPPPSWAGIASNAGCGEG